MRATTWPSILVATTNPGKMREIADLLSGLPVRWLTLTDLPAPPPEPEETGATFADNASLKARAYAYASALPTVAEDSGLAIDALDGRPGIHSARYRGESYQEKFQHLFTELAPHPRPWTARFVCALAFAVPTDGGYDLAFASEGMVEGEIVTEPRGTFGFGYDPIFYHAPFGATLGEVESTRKRAISHRGAAFRAFRRWLEEA